MTTRYNVIANVAGRVWGALMSFAFVPLYVRFIGIEGYGLIGFFTSMLAVFFVLDMGFSLTINRELARLSPEPEDRATARTLVRTLESIYWVIGLTIGGIIILSAPAIATHWLNVGTLPVSQTVHAIQLMGLVAMFRWPVALYSGALMGLRRQVLLNGITSAAATLQGGGAILILWLVAPTVTAFFAWQVGVAFLQIAVLIAFTWRSIPLSLHRARFQGRILRSIAGFSAGITGITVLSAILTQFDKFLLSRMLPLEQFGYYSMAGAIATLLIPAGGAIYSAVFPVFSALVASDDQEALTALYHKSCQILSVLIIPAATVIAFFAQDLLVIYLHDPKIVRGVSLLLQLQIVANAFLTLALLPVGLQLAFGWTKLSFYKNVVAIMLYVPLLFVVVPRFGAAGAAALWIMVPLGYFLIEVQIMHRRLLPGQQWRWYGIDVGVPAAVSIALVGAARLLIPATISPFSGLVLIALAGGLSLIASAAILPGPREILQSIATALKRRVAVRFAA